MGFGNNFFFFVLQTYSAIIFIVMTFQITKFSAIVQAEAVKWLHGNIDAFSGDKNRITLFGQSAGASAVGLLMASRHVRGT